jgi:hypothetical protein
VAEAPVQAGAAVRLELVVEVGREHPEVGVGKGRPEVGVDTANLVVAQLDMVAQDSKDCIHTAEPNSDPLVDKAFRLDPSDNQASDKALPAFPASADSKPAAEPVQAPVLEEVAAAAAQEQAS